MRGALWPNTSHLIICLPPALQSGYLFPTFHASYWFGLASNQSFYPIFGWLDPVFPGPTSESYRHWGTLKTGGGDSIPEPNNQQPQEYCAVCNATQTYGGAYGWADANCANKYGQMCRIQGGRPQLVLGDTSCSTGARICVCAMTPSLLACIYRFLSLINLLLLWTCCDGRRTFPGWATDCASAGLCGHYALVAE